MKPFFFVAGHVTSQMDFTKALNRLGESAIMREDEPDDIGAAFQKFAIVTKELALLMKNLVSSNIIYQKNWLKPLPCFKIFATLTCYCFLS